METCPHYLTLHAEDIGDGQTQFKCCPPVREAANADRLWQGLDGVIDFVVSDHSPCTVELKRLDAGDFGVAWGGISSLQLGLPLVWTEAGAAITPWLRWWAGWPAGPRTSSASTRRAASPSGQCRPGGLPPTSRSRWMPRPCSTGTRHAVPRDAH